MDGETAYYVETVRGVEVFLDELRSQLKDRSFRPLPVRERMIRRRQEAPFGDRRSAGPGGPGVLEAGVGADL